MQLRGSATRLRHGYVVAGIKVKVAAATERGDKRSEFQIRV